jgi:hypothetical protein
MTSENPNLADLDTMDGGPAAVSGDIVESSPAPLAENHTMPYPRRPGPAGNALQHGLTARTILPNELRLRTEHFAAELQRELSPAGCLQSVLVEELARHAAGMEFAGHAEGSILRYCGQQRAQLDTLLDRDAPLDVDGSFTAAISNQPLERLGRYRRLHERGFYDALSRLRDQQATRQQSTARAQFARFHNEEACIDHLFERARRRAGACPRCGERNGHWLSRRRWECSTCGLQVGLRFGSVMEGSRLPLRIWFMAIGAVLADPAIRPERLQQAIELPRLGTVRRLLRTIVEAIESPDVDRLLAGLQRLAP